VEVGGLTTEKKWTGQQKHARKMKFLLKESEGSAIISVVGLAGTSSGYPAVSEHRLKVDIPLSIIQGK
jgi:hypothetical protein